MTDNPKRGRPRAAPIEDTISRLERELAEARAAQKEQDAHRFAVVGAAVVAEATTDGEFRTLFHALLRKRVTGSADKALIAPLLVGGPAG